MDFSFFGCSGKVTLAVVIVAIASHCTQFDLGTASSNEICSDDFNRPDSADIGGNWDITAIYPQTNPPQFGIKDQSVWYNFPPQRFIGLFCKHRVEHSIAKVSLDIIPRISLSTQKAMLMGRAENSLNLYMCGFSQGKVALNRVKDGADVNLASDNTISSVTANVPISLTFEMNGINLTCTLRTPARSVIVRVTDGSFSTGQVGFLGDGFVGATNLDIILDNFKTEVFP